jgi:hypothetical protein
MQVERAISKGVIARGRLGDPGRGIKKKVVVGSSTSTEEFEMDQQQVWLVLTNFGPKFGHSRCRDSKGNRPKTGSGGTTSGPGGCRFLGFCPSILIHMFGYCTAMDGGCSGTGGWLFVCERDKQYQAKEKLLRVREKHDTE